MSTADSLSAPAARPASDPDRDPRLAVEWLETDGRGGYASSTPVLCPTRRYHGLLVAPAPGGAARYVFLARFDEVLVEAGGARWPLSVARHGDVLAPRGDEALARFELAPHPRATYRAGAARLSREVRMLRGSHTVLVRYALAEGGGPCALELRPLLPFREADALTIENDVADAAPERVPGGVRFRLYAALPALSLTGSAGDLCFEPDPTWYRDLSFAADRARGYGGREDELAPGVLHARLEPGGELIVAATIGAPLADPRAAWRAAGARDDAGAAGDALAARLERAADDFLYRTPEGRLGVVAGFPWFLEWGRDTFIALPGLTLARGRLLECAEVLTGALPFLRDGLLPNIFGTRADDSHYGSADAALWFARAVLLFARAGGDRALIERELRPALESIADAYLRGAPLGLVVDEAGMLLAGASGLNPTWMDAQTSAGPVTPRDGCPVEIAALWCSLLAHLEELAPARAARRAWAARRRAAQRAFVERFWMPADERLADGWRNGARVAALRPNMLLAAALELSPLTRSQRRAVVRAAEEELLTPRGLRTLSPRDPAYVGRYEGGPEERDAAYHQGTVWPWLLGFYVEASLRALPATRARRAALAALLDGLAAELERAGLGHVSEVFDGDAPQRPGGTIAQAWNTAEWLRARRMLAEGRP